MAKSKWPNVQEKIENGLVEGWARDGLTDEQIAAKLKISLGTYYNYQKEHIEFLEALKKGKEVIDYQVESALVKRALGYAYEEKTTEPLYNPVSGEPILDENGERLMAVTKIVTKKQAPDVTAQIFWLKNRKPKDWRDKPVVEDTSGLADDGFMDALDGKMGDVWDE